MVNVGTLATRKQITCHRRWRDNLSLGLFEKAVLLIIKVELPHQERLKTKKRFWHSPALSYIFGHKCLADCMM